MKFLRLTTLMLAVFVFSCKKNDVNFDKYNNTKIKPEVLTPLANARIVAGDLLKQDSIIKYDPDGLIRLTFTQDSVFVMDAQEILKDVSLGKSSSRFSIGELTVAGVEQTSSVSLNDLLAGATQQERDFLNFIDGKRDTFPAISASKPDITALAVNNEYEYLKISEGYLVFTVRNGFPTFLSDLEIGIYDSVSQPNPVLLGTVKFSNLAPDAFARDSINIGNRILSNALGYAVPVSEIAKSTDSVLINLNDKIDITVTYSNLTCIGGKAKLPAQQIPTEQLSIDLSDPNVDAQLRNI